MQLLNLKNKRVRTTLTSKITQEKKKLKEQKQKKKKSKGTEEGKKKRELLQAFSSLRACNT